MAFPMRKFEKSTKTITIRDWITEDLPDTDCSPIGQRLSRDPHLSLVKVETKTKSKEIINVILYYNMDMGTITVHEPNADYPSDYRIESIDGGHRKRAIRDFFYNKFPLYDGRFYRNLTDEEKQAFLNYEMHFTTYYNLAPHEVGFIFRTQNTTTKVNHQEMLNSYGWIPVANAIRETVREIPNHNSIPHDLFELGRAGQYKHLAFNNDGLRIDEMFARLFHLYYKNEGLSTSTNADLVSMYKSDISETEVSEIKEKVNECLDFMLRLTLCRKSKLNNTLPKREFTLFYRVFMYLQKTYPSFKIENYDEFWMSLNKVFSKFTNKEMYEQSDILSKVSPFDRNKTIGGQVLDCLSEYDAVDHVEYPIKMLLELGWNPSDAIIVKDVKRNFSIQQREAKLAEQDFKCAVDGKPLTLDESEAGHIIAHTNGGLTTYDNLAMVRAKWNKAMGSMDLNVFKEQMAL
jgi:hypothetical protein